MFALLADSSQSPVLGTQSLGQQARHQLLRMPRAASHAKRHQAGRPVDHPSSASASSSTSTSSCVSAPAPASSSPPASHPRRSHAKPCKSNGNASASNGSLARGHASCARSDAASSNGLPVHSNAISNDSSVSGCLSNGLAKHHNLHHLVAPARLRRDSVGSSSVSSSSAAESFTSQSSVHMSEDTHRRIDITAMKNPQLHRDPGPLGGALGAVMTVVSSCPVWDTLAILVLLAQLGPTMLSSVYMLFTFLTFVPPTTSTSFASLSVATVKEVFQESAFRLSTLTVLLVDAIMFLVWLFLTGSAQNLVLDLSKVVIAMTLGGGIGASDGGWKSVFACFCFLLLSHFSMQTKFQTWCRWALVKWSVDIDFPAASHESAPFSELRLFDQVGRSVMSLLAIHIFCQGVIKYVRDWLLRNQKREMQNHSIPDPEVGKLFPECSTADASSTAPENDPIVGTMSAAASARKKRKNNAQVRLQQPLWAAIASTKIVMTKEMELSKQKDLGGKPSELGHIGSAPFYKQDKQIWLCDVDSDEAFFATSIFPEISPPVVDAHHPDSSSLIDYTKPFYVRVNNAMWPSVQMHRVVEEGERDDNGEDDGDQPTSSARWKGRIPGLPSASNFVCEFVSTRNEEVLYSTSFRTRPAPAKDTDAAASPVPTPRTQRPESPVTTLKSSIKNLEAKHEDEKTKLRNLKKDNQAKIKAAKKEMERLGASIQSSGNNDAKYRSKIQASARLKQQHEEQAAHLEAELANLCRTTERLSRTKAQVEELYSQDKEKYLKAQAEHKAFKSALDQAVHSLEAEKSTLNNKRNKIASRLAKLDADLGRQSDLNAQGHEEAARRQRELENLDANGYKMEASMKERIRQQQERNQILERQIQAITEAAGQYFGQAPSLDLSPGDSNPATRLNPAAPQYNPSFHHPRPMNAATMNGFNPNPGPWANQQSATSGWGARGPVGAGAPQRTRGRSSSMLSTVSGLTHFSDDCDTVSANDHGKFAVSGPPPGLATPAVSQPPPGFSPSGMRYPPGLHPIRRTETSGSGGSGSASG